MDAVRKIIKGKNQQSRVVRIEEPRFIFLTAYSSQTFNQHMRELGTERVLEKPIQLSVLEEILSDPEVH